MEIHQSYEEYELSPFIRILPSPPISITSLDYLLKMRMLSFDCILFAQPNHCYVVFVRENCLVCGVCVQFNGKLMLILCCNFSLESFCGQIVQGKHISRMCWWYWWLGTSAISAASSFGSRQRIPCHLMVP